MTSVLNRTAPWIVTGLLSVWASGCGRHPEEALLGCWTETAWTYERVDERPSESWPESGVRWNDGVRARPFPESRRPRHEAELWWFQPRGELAIADVDGTLEGGRWRLKGRGHVLTIRTPDNGFEAYDIKELNEDQLVLNVDLGMEVRGIARLEFARTACGDALREGRLKQTSSLGAAS